MVGEGQKALHPVVDALVHTDHAISRILDERPNLRGPLLDAMRAIMRANRGEVSPEEALSVAQAVRTEGEDPHLVFLFLFTWLVLSCSSGRLTECSALLERAKALLAPSDPPELRTLVPHAEAMLARRLGNQDRANAILRQALQIAPAESPRRCHTVFDYAIALGPLWREPEADGELEALLRRDPQRWAGVVALRRFVHLLETGQAEAAGAALAAAECGAGAKFASDRALLALCRGILDLAKGGCLPSEGTPWALSILRPMANMLAGQPEEALRLVKGNLSQLLDNYLNSITFPSFNLVRAELACGHGGAARRIMDIRRRRGNVHPLDDFFMARVELLSGNRELAAELFTRALGVAEKHSAKGRLEFELKMSCELTPADMLWLMGGRNAGTVTGTAGVPAPLAPVATASEEPTGAVRLTGPSEAMKAVREAVRRFAPLDVPVLITGETGTGKELVARALHEDGPRRAEPFLAINCGAIVDALLESELFGHEKGAFTGALRRRRGMFEEAGRGTVFLDEIGEVSTRLQVALLRVLETGEVRPVGASRERKVACRVVAATNANLPEMINKGLFRQDLYYRLKRLEIGIPPLRERREDVLPLVDRFLGEGRADGGRATLSPELKEALLARDWPGNVRELKNEVERMRLMNSEGDYYDVSVLPDTAPAAGRAPAAEEPRASPEPPQSPAADLTEEIVRQCRGTMRRLDRLRELFRKHGKLTRSEAAQMLGISLPTATAYLKTLCAEQFIERVEPSASRPTHYFRLRS